MRLMVNSSCANCKQPSQPTDLYCAHCGCILPHAVRDLINSQVSSTNLLGDQQQPSIDLRWGTGYFHHHAKLFLQVEDTDLVIPVALHSASVLLGRSTLDTPVSVDLTPFNAAELGVSRYHARIDRLRDALQVTDLGSANGTWLNKDKLKVGTAHILRNRGVLQLGKLALRVQFL